MQTCVCVCVCVGVHVRVTALTIDKCLPSQECKRKKYLSRLRLGADERFTGNRSLENCIHQFRISSYARLIFQIYPSIFLFVYIFTHLLLYIYISMALYVYVYKKF